MADFFQNNIRVMVIDDVRVNLKILSSLIEEMGYHCYAYLEAKEAMEAIETIRPQLIILDVMMPDIDGYEFCHIIKKNANIMDIPVIFISAMDSPEDKERGFEAGAVDYIAQPFDRAEVTARITLHIKMYEMSQELEANNLKLNRLVIEQNKQIEEEKKNMLSAIAKMVENRDNLTMNHVVNIQYNSRLLAQSMQLCPEYEDTITNAFIENMEVASALHDVGKIFVPDDILLKPGRLDEPEMRKVQEHAWEGAVLLQGIRNETQSNEYLDMAIDIAAYHHENWDGSGYPKGLAGYDIPLSARLVHVIDVYDALTGQRCYKRAYTPEESIDIMVKEAGRSFEPEMITVFSKIWKQLKID